MKRWMTAIMILGVFLSACKTDTSVGHRKESCENVESDIDFVSYNAAWAPGMVPRTADRVGPSIDELGRIDFDVLCLQEAWLPEYRDAVAGALSLPDDQVFAVDTTIDDRGVPIGETHEDVCTSEELANVEACARKQCSGIESSETSFCVRSKCGKHVQELYIATKDDPACLRCIGAMAGRSIDDVHRVCTTVGASRIHKGNNDVMLLSRFPLLNKEYLVLPSSSSNRVALFATVAIPDSKVRVEVACLHVSASSFISPSHSGYESWSEEKAHQLDLVSEMLRRRAKRKNRAAVLMGDLNIGPDIKDGRYDLVEGHLGRLWTKVRDDGFIEPALKEDVPICTGSCPDNKIDPTIGEGSLIDHVLLRMPEKGDQKPLYSVCVDQVMDRPFVHEDKKRGKVDLSYSDHYGIRVKCKVTEPSALTTP